MSNSYDSSHIVDSNAVLDAALDALDYGSLQCALKNTFLHFYSPAETLGKDRPRLIRQSSDLQHTRDPKSRRHIESLSPLACTHADPKGNLSFDQVTTAGPNSTLSLESSTANPSEGEEEEGGVMNVREGGGRGRWCDECDEDTPPASTDASESIGSAGHITGTCRPCAWWWKPGGCFKGRTCEYCHLCDESTLHAWVAQRTRQQRVRRRAQKSDTSGSFVRASVALH